MRATWASSLGVALGCLVGHAHAGNNPWRAATPVAAGPVQAQPIVTLLPPVASLGAPVPVARSQRAGEPATLTDFQVTPVVFTTPYLSSQNVTVRAQMGDPPPPVPAATSVIPPLPPPTAPPPPYDPFFNSGPAPSPTPGAPSGGTGFWDQCREHLTPDFGQWTCNGRKLFQSDHQFDQFISPVSSPFLSEDPRSLTEIRPIFIYQTAPRKNWAFQGGDSEFLGVQARLALTERFSIVMNKLGGVWLNPNNGDDILSSSSGFSEIWVGPKYTFLRCEDTGTIGAFGVTFQIPVGSSKVFQDTGMLSVAPYLSMAQNFGKSSYGSFNAMGTLGYSIATDSARADYLYLNAHLDYDIAGLHKIYPLLELNWTHYTTSGTSLPLGFEGGDLVNFGTSSLSPHDNLSLAVGMRYKFCEWAQIGAAAEWGLLGTKDLNEFRFTLDLIFRY